MAIPKPGPKGLPKRDDEIHIVGIQLRLRTFFLLIRPSSCWITRTRNQGANGMD
jgi:hypothetical protein